jgi:hypothetical protein
MVPLNKDSGQPYITDKKVTVVSTYIRDDIENVLKCSSTVENVNI